MKKTLIHVVCLIGFAACVVGGFKLWQVRPWRVIASVNGHNITASELELRARTLLDDAKRSQNLFVPKEREGQALISFRRQATQVWIVKEVLLSAALARGFEVTPADEKESMTQMTARLKSRNLTPEQYFQQGPIPEAVKRQDFKEGVLINKFTAKEVRDKINVSTEEIDDWQAKLQQAALLRTKPGAKPAPPVSRKDAIDSLRGQRYREGFRKLFRDLYAKAQVSCPEYPEMESLEGVSPSRAEDRAQPAAAPLPPPAEKPAAAPEKPAHPVITPATPVVSRPKNGAKPADSEAVKSAPAAKPVTVEAKKPEAKPEQKEAAK